MIFESYDHKYTRLFCIGVVKLIECGHQAPYKSLEDVNSPNHNRREVREYYLEEDTEIAVTEVIPTFSHNNTLSEMVRSVDTSSPEINHTADELSYSKVVNKTNEHEEVHNKYEEKTYDGHKSKAMGNFPMEKPTFNIVTERFISTTHEPRKRSKDLTKSMFDLGKENSTEHIQHEGVVDYKNSEDLNASNITKSGNISDNKVATSLTSINTSPFQPDLQESMVFQPSRYDADSEDSSEKDIDSQQDFYPQHPSHDQNIVVYQPQPEILPGPSQGLLPTPHITKIPILAPNDPPRAVYSANKYEDSRILRFFRGGPSATHQPILHHVEHSIRHPTPEYDIEDYSDTSYYFHRDLPPYPAIDPIDFDRIPLHLPNVVSHHNSDKFDLELT
ncbi:hypothetical protein J6590_048799 [Homalodisca vitripennis]|nr:hypothetical protein J6590_048799 [Homalodisca vitripennis]